MSATVRPSTRAAIGGLAAAGTVAAHHLAYLIAEPDAGHRQELLVASGHERWPAVIALAMGLLVAGLCGFALSTVRSADAPVLRFGAVTARLAGLQATAFVVLEAIERIAVGDGVAALAGERAVYLGIVLQLVTALVGALLLLLWARVVISFRPERSFGGVDEATVVWFVSLVAARRPWVASGAGTPRGPPQLALL
ncbi:MAG: hypothetical protein ACRDKZ_08245 [Actinomycetota bacterium]